VVNGSQQVLLSCPPLTIYLEMEGVVYVIEQAPRIAVTWKHPSHRRSVGDDGGVAQRGRAGACETVRDMQNRFLRKMRSLVRRA
jgi:hypothetical protein